MDLARFKASLTMKVPPKGLSLALQALWWDAKGDWAKAHDCVDEEEDAEGMRVHAYLHRKEGDLSNARYWYGRAGKSAPHASLDAEWEAILRALLKHASAE